jgi:hypothetical protein
VTKQVNAGGIGDTDSGGIFHDSSGAGTPLFQLGEEAPPSFPVM